MLMNRLIEQLIKSEGLKLKPYEDKKKKLTIGVGRNLTDNGISVEEAKLMLKNDLEWVFEALDKVYYPWKSISVNRQLVLSGMMFNLGETKFKKFTNFWKAIKNEDYAKASIEMMVGSKKGSKSQWAKDVGKRAIHLSEMMSKG